MRREIGTHKTESEGNSSSRLAEILDQLPIAITLFDRAGQFIVRSGALRRMFGERIPARDPEQAARWKVFDYEGRALDPPEWPGVRVLRGETGMVKVTGRYAHSSGEHRWLRISVAPFTHHGAFAGGIGLIQDLDKDRRAQDRLRDELEERFVDVLIGAIGSVSRDSSYPDPVAARAFMRRTLGLPPETERSPPDGLTEREAEVLRLVAWGKSNKEIGLQLGISPKTVEFHRHCAVGKLRLHNRTDILRYALSQHWLIEEKTIDPFPPG